MQNVQRRSGFHNGSMVHELRRQLTEKQGKQEMRQASANTFCGRLTLTTIPRLAVDATLRNWRHVRWHLRRSALLGHELIDSAGATVVAAGSAAATIQAIITNVGR